MGEFDFIARIQQRLTGQSSRLGIDLGIGDDAAILSPPPGQRLVVTTDTLNAGVHFPRDTAAFDIGYKTLAVNLSDLAAMGADPWACTLNITLPQMDPVWMDAWLDGFFAVADMGGIMLVGGDTTRGESMSFSVTAMGLLPEQYPGLRRANALPGDDVWVSGELGDAALALRMLPDVHGELLPRLNRPTPRTALGLALRGLHEIGGCCDVSDGLLQDLGHIARASGARIEIESDRIPMSDAVEHQADALQLALTGGDDYELAFTAARGLRDEVRKLTRTSGVRLTRIGTVFAGEPSVCLLDAHGREIEMPVRGFDHFATK